MKSLIIKLSITSTLLASLTAITGVVLESGKFAGIAGILAVTAIGLFVTSLSVKE